MSFIVSCFLSCIDVHGEGWTQKLQKIGNEVQAQNGLVVEWKKVEMSVIKSQPPRPEDVPSIVRFVKHWGGGQHATYIKEINNYVQCGLIPTDRHVAQSFFDSLAKLEFRPDELPPHFIIATLVAHASCPDAFVIDDIARFITTSEVAGIARSPTKELVIEANKIIHNSKQLVISNNIDSSVASHMLVGLCKDLVMLTLKPKLSKFATFAEIVGKFAASMVAMGGSAEIVDSAATDGDGAAIEVPNIAQYDSTGRPIAAFRTTVLARGFAEGCSVYRFTAIDQSQSKIISIGSDGKVTLVPFAHDGAPASDEMRYSVAFEEFLGNFKVAKKKYEPAPWPENSTRKSEQYTNITLKSMVVIALHDLDKSSADPNVRVQAQPRPAVFATATIASKELLMVPATMALSAEDDSKKRATFCCKITGSDQLFNLMPQKTKECAAPCWYVRASDDADEANVTIKNVNMYMSRASDTKTGRGKVHVISIPCLTNNKKIEIGDEIVMFKEAEEKPDPSSKKRVATIGDSKVDRKKVKLQA